MAKVKPTRVTTPRIIQPGSGSRTWLWMLLLLALAAWSWQVFEFGRERAGFDIGRHGESESGLRAQIVQLEQQRDLLRASAAKFERAAQIDRAAVEGVMTEVKALQDERAELKREVAFLKTLVAGGGSIELVLDERRLIELDERSFRFEAKLSKRIDDDETVSGQVVIRVSGTLDGEDKSLDMQTLTDGKRTHIGIRFKNFQKLKTDLNLPEGFVPASVEVVVTSDDNTFKSFEQAYDWKPSDA